MVSCRMFLNGLISLTVLGLTTTVAVAHPPDDAGPHHHGESSRTWTNAVSGEAIRGSFLAARDGKIGIERDTGGVVVVPLADLSEADRAEANRRISEILEINERLFGPIARGAEQPQDQPGKAVATNPPKPEQTAPFEAFAPFVKTRWDDRFLYVESDGLPHAPAEHPMMIGITAWQQQVPLPQAYSGDNAWRIPLRPELADAPVSAKSQLFRGAIALAANGIPIFNPIKNDGRTDTFLAGELDEFGGHCGRADDYHYHIAPLSLQKVLGKDKPVAYALDGFAIYGLFDPLAKKGADGCCPLGCTEPLDELNGHFAPAAEGAAPGTKGIYHYHATKAYPYLNGGMRGKVTVKDDQIDPQPRATSPRPALPPLRGAKITGFSRDDAGKSMTVKYELAGKTCSVRYVINPDASVTFVFTDGDGKETTQTHRGRARGDRDERPPRENGRPPRDGGRKRNREAPGDEAPPASASSFKLTSPAVAEGADLPDEFNGNGEGATLPLAWSGAPEGTKSYAIIMDHTDREGVLKVYWTVYDVPGETTSLPKNVKGVGKLGATWKRGETYVTPHSAGPGTHTYTIHLYALKEAPVFEAANGLVTRDMLIEKIKNTTLGTAELHVTYTRPAGAAPEPPKTPDGKGGRKKGEPK